MARELRYLKDALRDPARPFTGILGGAKISGKIGVISALLGRVDRLLIGGAMANTFFRAQGLDTGASLVEEEARLASLGQHTWAEARRNKDFEQFRPLLEEIIELLRRKAECYGWEQDGEPWDALAEDYEPGATAKDIEVVFTPLRDRLQTLLRSLMDSPAPPSNAFNEVPLPIEKQRDFVQFVAEQIGFDFTRGRLDISTHPFCSGSATASQRRRTC